MLLEQLLGIFLLLEAARVIGRPVFQAELRIRLYQVRTFDLHPATLHPANRRIAPVLVQFSRNALGKTFRYA